MAAGSVTRSPMTVIVLRILRFLAEKPGRQSPLVLCVCVWWEMQGLWSSYCGIYIYGIYIWYLYSSIVFILNIHFFLVNNTLIFLRGTSSLPLSHVVWVCTGRMGTEAVFLALFHT